MQKKAINQTQNTLSVDPRTALQQLKKHPFGEIEYRSLKSFFSGYAYPSRKIQDLEAQQSIVRMRKGFYVISTQVNGKEIQKGIVANLMYGPSYVSLEYALAHYGLIPERVYACTSVTSQKNKKFKTPHRDFIYQHMTKDLFSLAIQLEKTGDGRRYLMATPEKALLDHITLRRTEKDILNLHDVESYLVEDMRIDVRELRKRISQKLLLDLRPFYYRRRRARLLIDFLTQKSSE